MSHTPSQTREIPARRGIAVHVPKDHTIQITNTHGTQVVDTWAFTSGGEYLSMSHTHASTHRLIPRTGDTLVSNLRQPMLTVTEDTAAVHDTVIAACDPQRYRQLGAEKWEEHGSCAQNLVAALAQINGETDGTAVYGAGVTVDVVPQPLNLFMNIPFTEDGSLEFGEPKGRAGEFVRLRAERDLVVVMSACPQDIIAINGKGPVEAHFAVHAP